MRQPLSSSLLNAIPGIRHQFGDRAEPIPQLWDETRPQWKQVHGIAAAEAKFPREELGEVDAIYTRASRLPIAVVTADCVPILLAREDGGVIAAVHAGWRGTFNGILAELWNTLRRQGENPAHWKAAIGPAIGPCCYQVAPELARDFQVRFSRHLSLREVTPEERMLDLPAINAAILREAGMREIELLRQCTQCTKDPASQQPQYESYRRDHSKARQFAVIVRCD